MSADDDVLKPAAFRWLVRQGPPTIIIVGGFNGSALGLPGEGAYELRDGEYFHVEIKSERKFGIMSFWDEEL